MRRLAVMGAAAAILVAVIVAGEIRTQGRDYPVPASIASDCSVDVAAALNEFFGSVPDGGPGPLGSAYRRILFKPGGCYRVEAPLLLSRRSYLRLEGQGATIESHDVDESGSQPAFRVQFSHHVYFGRFQVVGDNPNPGVYTCDAPPPGNPCRYEWSYGWGIGGSHDIEVRDSATLNTEGDGVAIHPQWDGRTPVNTHNVTVSGVDVDGTGRVGFSVTGGHDVILENSDLRNTPWVFDLELEWASAGFGIERVTIRGNTTGLYRLVWLANAGECGKHADIVVEGNVMERSGPTSWPPISVQNPAGCAPRGPYTVRGNTFRMPWGGAYYGAQFTPGATADVEVHGNTFIWEAPSLKNHLARLQNAHGVRITDNVLQGASFLVLDLGNSDWSQSGNRCGAVACR